MNTPLIRINRRLDLNLDRIRTIDHRARGDEPGRQFPRPDESIVHMIGGIEYHVYGFDAVMLSEFVRTMLRGQALRVPVAGAGADPTDVFTRNVESISYTWGDDGPESATITWPDGFRLDCSGPDALAVYRHSHQSTLQHLHPSESIKAAYDQERGNPDGPPPAPARIEPAAPGVLWFPNTALGRDEAFIAHHDAGGTMTRAEWDRTLSQCIKLGNFAHDFPTLAMLEPIRDEQARLTRLLTCWKPPAPSKPG